MTDDPRGPTYAVYIDPASAAIIAESDQTPGDWIRQAIRERLERAAPTVSGRIGPAMPWDEFERVV